MRRTLSLVYGAIALLSLASASGEPNRARGASASASRSLRDRVGVDAARSLLREESSAARQRGFERLGTAGTPRALELLARALDADGTARDARERLSVVRALAPSASDATAEEALVRALGGVEGRSEERDLLVERTSALALARVRTSSALGALSRALRQPGRVSEHAADALAAHPPKNLAPLLEASGQPTPALLRLLGELGDARARPLVEKANSEGSAVLRAAALEATFRLDRARALSLAQAGLASQTERELRLAVAHVLMRAGDALAPRALGALLRDPSTRAAALNLALETPSAALGATLAQAPAGEDDDRLLAALGRAGGPEALARLQRSLLDPRLAWSALYSLALSPDDGADAVLERALERGELRRDTVRAMAIRATAHGRTPPALGRALPELGRGKAADRAVAAWYGALCDPEHARSALTGRDAAIVRATARAALDPMLAIVAAERLAHEGDPTLGAALAVALAQSEAADRVPTAKLVSLYEAHGAASYLAAFALAVRDSELLRPRLRELLLSDDPRLREHVALGLGKSTSSSAVGLLGDAYRGEADAGVRRAIVRALASRTEPGAVPFLRLAADLEPDHEARTLARAALARTPAPAPLPTGTLWLHFDAPTPEPRFALVTSPSGVALPFSSDPDGTVAVSGLPSGDVSVQISAAIPGQPSGSGAP